MEKLTRFLKTVIWLPHRALNGMVNVCSVDTIVYYKHPAIKHHSTCLWSIWLLAIYEKKDNYGFWNALNFLRISCNMENFRVSPFSVAFGIVGREMGHISEG